MMAPKVQTSKAATPELDSQDVTILTPTGMPSQHLDSPVLRSPSVASTSVASDGSASSSRGAAGPDTDDDPPFIYGKESLRKYEYGAHRSDNLQR